MCLASEWVSSGQDGRVVCLASESGCLVEQDGRLVCLASESGCLVSCTAVNRTTHTAVRTEEVNYEYTLALIKYVSVSEKAPQALPCTGLRTARFTQLRCCTGSVPDFDKSYKTTTSYTSVHPLPARAPTHEARQPSANACSRRSASRTEGLPDCGTRQQRTKNAETCRPQYFLIALSPD